MAMKATAATTMPAIAPRDRLFPLSVDEDGLAIVNAPVFVGAELLLVDVIYRQTCSTLAVIGDVAKNVIPKSFTRTNSSPNPSIASKSGVKVTITIPV